MSTNDDKRIYMSDGVTTYPYSYGYSAESLKYRKIKEIYDEISKWTQRHNLYHGLLIFLYYKKYELNPNQ